MISCTILLQFKIYHYPRTACDSSNMEEVMVKGYKTSVDLLFVQDTTYTPKGSVSKFNSNSLFSYYTFLKLWELKLSIQGVNYCYVLM